MDNEIPKHRAKKKDTKKWCRGKVGVAHDPAWKTWHRTAFLPGTPLLAFVCRTCGKELDLWSSSFSKRPKPEVGSTTPLPRR